MFRILGADDDLKGNREELIADLSEKCLATDVEATLFFDAQYNPEENQRFHRKDFEIRYTDYLQTADDCIIEALKEKKSTKGIIVVSSDKKLAWRARRRGAETMSVEEFYDILNRRWQNKTSGKKKKKEIPIKNLPLDQFETYLAAFEKELKEEPPSPEEKPISETERWRRIFEQRLEKEMEDNHNFD
jgi:predicted RNA-binding protein with PIN domain